MKRRISRMTSIKHKSNNKQTMQLANMQQARGEDVYGEAIEDTLRMNDIQRKHYPSIVMEQENDRVIDAALAECTNNSVSDRFNVIPLSNGEGDHRITTICKKNHYEETLWDQSRTMVCERKTEWEIVLESGSDV